MGSFDFLSAEQTIFSNPDALDLDFIPKLLPHREEQQKYIATAIKPLFHNRTGKHLLIKGASGIGKTAATKRVLMDLEDIEEADNIARVVINCWKANTSYKVAVEIAHALGFKFTHNMKTNEVLDKIVELLGKRQGFVLVLDEIDKADEYDFLYFILEMVKRLTLIVITNDMSWGSDLDSRIKSRLAPETLEFKPYNPSETEDILSERLKYSFYQDVWDKEAFQRIVEKAINYRDIRIGIMLLRSAGEIAENASSARVKLEHAEKAILNIDEFKIRTSSDLTDEEKIVLNVCRQNSGKTTGKMYKAYCMIGGKKSEKTFKRNVDKLAKKNILDLEPTKEGFHGQSTKINYIGFKQKLTGF